MFSLTQEELGGLRHEDEGHGDEEAGDGTEEGEQPPAGPVHLVGDHSPGEAGHHHVTNHPEGGEDTQGPTSLVWGLELGKVGPYQGDTTSNSENKLKIHSQ